MGRVQGDGGEQWLDLAHEDLVGPVAQGVVPLGGEEDLHALGFQRRQDVAAQHLVLAFDQLARADGQRGDAGACRGRQRGVASGDFLQLGHADLEQLVKVAGNDGDVAQPFQQRGVGGFGQRQHAAVEGDDALLAVQWRGQGGGGGVVHAGSSGIVASLAQPPAGLADADPGLWSGGRLFRLLRRAGKHQDDVGLGCPV